MNSAQSFAIGEVEALVLKAYRGAGFSWGMAQEAGRAAGWLAGKELPALDAFAALLDQTAGQAHAQLAPSLTSAAWPANWAGPADLLCPVICGALLSDKGPTFIEEEATVTIASVASPLILLPFVATLGIPVHLGLSGIEVSIFGDAIEPFPVSTACARKQDVVLQLSDCRQDLAAGNGEKEHGTPARSVRGIGDTASIELLEALAHQTYVPATQASRESGAGAGLEDND